MNQSPATMASTTPAAKASSSGLRCSSISSGAHVGPHRKQSLYGSCIHVLNAALVVHLIVLLPALYVRSLRELFHYLSSD